MTSKLTSHSKSMAVALYEGDIEKARHEHKRLEKAIYGASPRKGREERFQQMRKEIMKPFESPSGTKSMERLP